MNKEKILIIKTGYCEFLYQGDNSRRVSLGDVLRTTPLLHIYKNDNVTWVTDHQALPLLEGNIFINRLLSYDFTTALQLESEEFDNVINLEKVPGICALSDKIRARRKRYGFTFNTQLGEAEALDKAYEVMVYSSDIKLKRDNKKTFQELLFEMVGQKWKNEEYSLGYKPRSSEIYDVGLNTRIGEKWSTKKWPEKYWDKLEDKLIKNKLKISRQDKQGERVLNNLYDYIDWINSCKIIVSNDSLGMHLGIVLKKNVLGLFGPTSYKEIYFYNKGEAIFSELASECMPCFKGICKRKNNCMEEIFVERVYREIKKYL